MKDATERVLQELLSDDVAILYNWCGKRFKDRVNKLPTKDTGIPEIIFRKSFFFRSHFRHEIKGFMYV